MGSRHNPDARWMNTIRALLGRSPIPGTDGAEQTNTGRTGSPRMYDFEHDYGTLGAGNRRANTTNKEPS